MLPTSQNRNQSKPPYTLIGKLVTAFSELVSILEVVLLESRSQFDNRFWDAGLGEKTAWLISRVDDELKKTINESPWATVKQKKSGLAYLRQLIKDLYRLNIERNIVAHGSWKAWSKTDSFVYKTSKIPSPKVHTFQVTESDLRNRISIAEELYRDVSELFDKYKYGDGLPMTPRWEKIAGEKAKSIDRLFNRLIEDLNLNAWQAHHLWRIGIRSRNDFRDRGIEKIKRAIELDKRKKDPELELALETAFRNLN